MCGIVGAVGKCDGARFAAALESIRHRGPDAEGMLFFDPVGENSTRNPDRDSPADGVWLGHRRLSVIDLSAEANQPMEHEEFVLVFNGEIYNYREIRADLQKEGCSFATDSDSEVLLKAYARWGEECVGRFNGMWAFAILDRKRKRCFLSRDRMGVKPLYYARRDGNFFFASEIKALLALGIPPVARREMLLQYLIYGAQESGGETTFRDVYRLPAGTNAVLDLEEMALETAVYFDLRSEVTESEDLSEEEALELVREDVARSIDLRLRSDVPIGMALSGGVDSNIVVHSVHPRAPEIGSFSSVYTEDETINETGNIDRTVRELGIESHLTTVGKEDIGRFLETIVWHQDEPFDTLGILAQNRVYALMREHGVKVSLDGQGDDEIFAGYPTYVPVWLKENLLNFSRYAEWFHCGYLNAGNMRLTLFAFVPALFERLYFRKRARKLFSRPPAFAPCMRKGVFRWGSLNRKLADDTREYLQVLLRYVDRNSMQFSIESRGIFLDYLLALHGLGIPPRYKIRRCFSKYVLRKAFEDIVPAQIIWDRKKLGFPVPQKQWMADPEIAKMFREYLDNSRILPALGIDRRPEPTDDLYWRMVNIAVWEKVFAVEAVA